MIASNASKIFDQKLLAAPDALEETFFHLFQAIVPKDGWQVHRTPPWLLVQPSCYTLPNQGWKLHITATPQNAVRVLESCLPILFRQQAWFKFILTKRLLHLLNTAHAPRMSSGKFITIYPRSLEACKVIAAACHEETEALYGPTILSDKPLRPGSSVHYRYGAFKACLTYDADALAVYVLQGSDGKPVEDIRSVSSRQPEWVKDDPFAETPTQQPSGPRPSSVLLNRRYVVTHALQHANKGGVYLAEDTTTKKTVVIKEARPYVGNDDHNRDATDRLRQEFKNLELLYPFGIVPRPIELFEQSGHQFMAMEWIQGVNLRQYVNLQRREHRTRLRRRELLTLCRKVSRLLHLCHLADLVFRDFTPNNIIVAPKGRLILVDPEMACRRGESEPLAGGEGTFAYASPQQLANIPPEFSDDYFSLGAIIFFLTTLRDPLFPSDQPTKRSLENRVAAYLGYFSRTQPVPTAMLDAIQANLKMNPQGRWSASRVLSHLSCTKSNSITKTGTRAQVGHLGSLSALRRIAKDLAFHISGSLNFVSSDRPIPATCFGEQTYPCNIQHGTAGIGLSLLALARATEMGSCVDSLVSLCKWTVAHRKTSPADPPGLYFGTAGTAWFLLEAADFLHREDLRMISLAMVHALPSEPPLADITHGAAGIGLTCIKFFLQTGDSTFLEKARTIARHLISSFSFSQGHGILWSKSQLPKNTPPSLGDVFYGFAHGTAGISYFLLCLHIVDNDSGLLEVVDRSAVSLFDAASFERQNLYWPHGPTNTTKWPHWCNGSSGVGTFLLRYALVTQSQQAAGLALQASRAMIHERWGHSCGQCHGLAGNAEYLLDLASFTGDGRFVSAARELAEIINLHRIYRSPGITFPDDSGFPTGLDFSTGAAGIAHFFSRLIGNLPRAVMLDEFLEIGDSRSKSFFAA